MPLASSVEIIPPTVEMSPEEGNGGKNRPSPEMYSPTSEPMIPGPTSIWKSSGR